MYRRGVQAIQFELLRQTIGAMFCAGKDQYLFPVIAANQQA